MEEFKLCPICNNEVEYPLMSDHGWILNYDCTICGKYTITSEAKDDIDINNFVNGRAKLSYWIKNHQSNEFPIKLTRSLIIEILDTIILPKPKELADNFIKLIGDSVSSPNGEFILAEKKIVPLIGANNSSTVRYIAEHLFENDFINTHFDSKKEFQGHLTFDGWERYDEILHESKESTTAFMAMKFGKEETDNLYKNVLLEAVRQTGFDLRKLDDNPEAGLIDDRLRVEIRKAKFLISDLTHDNPGAYFEAGFAEGLGKKVIYICEKEKFEKHKTHFDTNHHLTLIWDLSRPKEFAESLKATIRATFPNEAKMEDD